MSRDIFKILCPYDTFALWIFFNSTCYQDVWCTYGIVQLAEYYVHFTCGSLCNRVACKYLHYVLRIRLTADVSRRDRIPRPYIDRRSQYSSNNARCLKPHNGRWRRTDDAYNTNWSILKRAGTAGRAEARREERLRYHIMYKVKFLKVRDAIYHNIIIHWCTGIDTFSTNAREMTQFLKPKVIKFFMAIFIPTDVKTRLPINFTIILWSPQPTLHNTRVKLNIISSSGLCNVALRVFVASCDSVM